MAPRSAQASACERSLIGLGPSLHASAHHGAPLPTGKCLRAELDWARTKFALVVLTEMKSIDLTPLLNTYGPPSDERPPSSDELADELADEL